MKDIRGKHGCPEIGKSAVCFLFHSFLVLYFVLFAGTASIQVMQVQYLFGWLGILHASLALYFHFLDFFVVVLFRSRFEYIGQLLAEDARTSLKPQMEIPERKLVCSGSLAARGFLCFFSCPSPFFLHILPQDGQEAHVRSCGASYGAWGVGRGARQHCFSFCAACGRLYCTSFPMDASSCLCRPIYFGLHLTILLLTNFLSQWPRTPTF